MRCYADLHIHSCLSPCADETMTPNNIVGMAYLKKLDVIAVTDHNTAGNLRAVKEVCDVMGVGLLPGIEVTTAEDVHMLCYFRTVDEAAAFSDKIYGFLPDIANRTDIFGEQLYMNEQDEAVGSEPRLLLSGLELSIDEVYALAQNMGGLCVPAHIGRGANGILNALGMLPANLSFAAVELSRGINTPEEAYGRYKTIISSDAHRLEDISERDFFIETAAPGGGAVFDALKECEKAYAVGKNC